jgi:hypothetical protein
MHFSLLPSFISYAIPQNISNTMSLGILQRCSTSYLFWIKYMVKMLHDRLNEIPNQNTSHTLDFWAEIIPNGYKIKEKISHNFCYFTITNNLLNFAILTKCINLAHDFSLQESKILKRNIKVLGSNLLHIILYSTETRIWV